MIADEPRPNSVALWMLPELWSELTDEQRAEFLDDVRQELATQTADDG
jgi:hypothetical protein